MFSTSENEDNDFVVDQEKALLGLKRIAEQLKGCKITENCFEQSQTERDDTILDQSTHKSKDNDKGKDLPRISDLSIRDASIVSSQISEIHQMNSIKQLSIDLNNYSMIESE